MNEIPAFLHFSISFALIGLEAFETTVSPRQNFLKEVGYVPFNEQEYAAISNHYKTLQTGTAYKKPEIGLSVKQILEMSAANND